MRSQLNNINKDWFLFTGYEPFTAWLDYGEYIGVKFNTKKLTEWRKLIEEVSFYIPYDGVCFVSERPTEINWSDKRLHGDGKPAVKWADGYAMYALNGVSVPMELAMTEAGQLSIDLFMKEKNADVKAEFLKKYGMDRMVKHGVVVDSHDKYDDEWYHKSEYKLIDMGNILSEAGYLVTYAPYLYMRNQTTGTYHLEGVHPNCRTVKEAMKFRMGVDEQFVIGDVS